MSWLKRLFGGGDPAVAPEAEAVEHKGFFITPTPIPEQGQFRISAKIEKEVAGETRTHHLIRTDLIRDLDEAQAASVNKARQMIDQLGDGVFD